jgi:hypothetical protein
MSNQTIKQWISCEHCDTSELTDEQATDHALAGHELLQNVLVSQRIDLTQPLSTEPQP